MSSCHGMYSTWSLHDPRFHEYQCFSDGENHDFRGLDHCFPGSKFILTSRKLEDWLQSRVRHVEIRRAQNRTGWMRKEYESDPKKAIERWIKIRAKYHSEVLNYFADRSSIFLTLNICDSSKKERSIERLVDFLQLSKNAADEFPHERSSDQVTKDLGGGIRSILSKKYKPRSKADIKSEIQATLIELDIPEADWSSDGLPVKEL